jgi:cytochrome c-type biogenesis protein CcmH
MSRLSSSLVRITARTTPRLVMLSVAAVLATVALAAPEPRTATAQVPATEEQAIAIERQLLCPICTNERLDVCALAICQDMKRIIRERLAAGSTPDDILLYFETRYGKKVRAHLEPSGFNLWLYGWIVVSVVGVGGAGAWFLLRTYQRSKVATAAAGPATVQPSATVDDEWLDAEIAASEEREG